jgi:hypothetical protein
MLLLTNHQSLAIVNALDLLHCSCQFKGFCQSASAVLNKGITEIFAVT